MTPEEVRGLIAAGESMTVEFKADEHRGLHDGTIVEAASCLANGGGGTLLLGVSDAGAVTGLRPRHGSVTEAHRIDALVLSATVPPLATSTELVNLDGLEIAVVSVPPAAFPVGTTGGKYLKRALDSRGEPQCVPYPLHEMFSAGLMAQGADLAAVPARGAGMEDLDPREFERFRELSRKRGGDRLLVELSDPEILTALRLRRSDDPDGVTFGAVLLFGTEAALRKHLPNHEVLFDELRHDRIIFSETLRAPLLKTMERLEEIIAVRNTEEEFQLGLVRVGVPRVPPEVVRESLANALVHRDYTALGAVRVQLDEAEFRVTSPGGFPLGVTLDNLLSASVPRSPVLADAFKRAGLVDRVGRGIREMYDHLLRAGRGAPDYTSSTDRFVEVVVPTSDADLDFARFVLEFEDRRSEPLKLQELRVLHELKEGGPQSISELAEALDLGVPVIRPTLRVLSGEGLVDVRGAGRNRRYSLTASFYRIAEASEYVRMLDTDPIQQAQMVLDYVARFGSITRSKAAELCRITSPQASALLQRMAREGRLEMLGARRTARYELPAGSRGEGSHDDFPD